MTRRDHELLSGAIREAKLAYSKPIDADIRVAFNAFAIELATKLSRDNPRFDRDRFLNACVA